MERSWETLLASLYAHANYRFGDCPEREMLVQEAFVALIAKEKKDGPVDDPMAFLCTVLHHKHNDWLRRKYRDAVVTYELPELAAPEEEDRSEEYDVVRREIGRLLCIYREVTVRHYMHGHTVERIARDLGVPKGTVLSRLSTARLQLKRRLASMKTYSEYSYEPKRLTIGIHGEQGIRGEPHSAVASLIEQNVLIIAYEKPLSVQVIADTMGIACAYLEPIVDKLVENELLGRTSGGLVYTRFLIVREQERYGDIVAQKALAERRAEAVWSLAWKVFAPLMAHEELVVMNDKQRATWLLFCISMALSRVLMTLGNRPSPPERPNGGRWLAIGTVKASDESMPLPYASSGPFTVLGRGKTRLQVYDYQSAFGDTHWRYKTLRYRCSHQEISRFFASLYDPRVSVREPVHELIPDFEAMHLLRRAESGEIRADYPGVTFAEYETYWEPAIKLIAAELQGLLGEDLQAVCAAFKHRVPAHIDCAEQLRHFGALQAYIPAQLLSIVWQEDFPYPVTIGETPILAVIYDTE